MSDRKDGCECNEVLEFRITQFKILAAIGAVLGILIVIFCADPGVAGH